MKLSSWENHRFNQLPTGYPQECLSLSRPQPAQLRGLLSLVAIYSWVTCRVAWVPLISLYKTDEWFRDHFWPGMGSIWNIPFFVSDNAHWMWKYGANVWAQCWVVHLFVFLAVHFKQSNSTLVSGGSTLQRLHWYLVTFALSWHLGHPIFVYMYNVKV